MSKKTEFQSWWEKLQKVSKKDKRYSLQAYQFVFEALDFTAQKLGKNLSSPHESERHVTAPQLLEGIREYSLKQFGYMTTTLFELWGIRCCEDFGEVIFNLVESGLMGKTESDSKNDFRGGYDFRKSFEEDFKFEGKFNLALKWEPVSLRRK